MERVDGWLLSGEDALALLPVLRAGVSALAERGRLGGDARAVAQGLLAFAAASSLPSREKLGRKLTEVAASSESQSASCDAVSVEELADTAGVTRERVRQWLREYEQRAGRRLPRRGRSYLPLPPLVASAFLAQTRSDRET